MAVNVFQVAKAISTTLQSDLYYMDEDEDDDLPLGQVRVTGFVRVFVTRGKARVGLLGSYDGLVARLGRPRETCDEVVGDVLKVIASLN